MYSSSSSSSSQPPTSVSLPHYPNLTAAPISRFDVSVTDPERKGEGIQQFICYKVSSVLEYENEPPTQSCVIRRFSDFVWLHDSLESECRGFLIPPLPDKGLMNRFSREFVEERRRALQLFLTRILDHVHLRLHTHVILFLTGTDIALTNARTQGESVKTSTTKSIMSFFTSSMQLVTSTLAPGREHPKSEDDLACEKIQEYAVTLQTELAAMESQVETWLTKEEEVSKSWTALSTNVNSVAKAESEGRATPNENEYSHTYSSPPSIIPSAPVESLGLGLGGDMELSRLLSLLGRTSFDLGYQLQVKSQEEAVEFKEPLKDAQRMAMAVENMLKRRAACLAEYHILLDACDAARAKLVTAQSTPGKEGKLPQLESALAECDRDTDTKKFELSQLSHAVRTEFERSQQEKNTSLALIVKSFIKLQLKHSQSVMNMWQNVLQIVEQPIASSAAASSSSSSAASAAASSNSAASIPSSTK